MGISSEAELDASENEALKGERAPIVAAFAAENGFAFSADDLVTVVDAFQRHQSGALSDEAFAALVGMSASNNATQLDAATNPLNRLTRYLGKTYLGLG